MQKRWLQTKQKILSTCVRLFLTQGYTNTSISQIIKEAHVSRGSLQNLFHTKDAILMELVQAMFTKQFNAAKTLTKNVVSPIYTYALETAIQLTLTELNENLREIYIISYTIPSISEYIFLQTTEELYTIFGSNFDACTKKDFYQYDIGTSGMMRNYMAKKCDIHFSLEEKIQIFLKASLRVYRVNEKEINDVIDFIQNLDLIQISNDIIHKMFTMLEMQFDFKLSK